jgi:hypothetical protein
MLVYIENIKQRFELNTGDIKISAEIKLPTGTVVEVPLEEEQLMLILRASIGSSPLDKTSEQPALKEEEERTEQDLVNWAELSTSILSDDAKSVLRGRHAAPEIPVDELVRFVSEDLPALTQAVTEVAQPAAHVVSAQPVRRTTVQQDEYGYPVISGQYRAPSQEVVSGDEDGISSL